MAPRPRPREVLIAELCERYAEHMALPVELRAAIDARRVLPVADLMELLARGRYLE